MRKPTIKHEYLRKIMQELDLKNKDNITLEQMETLIGELKHSCLIVAANEVPGGLDILSAPLDGKRFGFLFTDMDEFRKFIRPDKCEAHHNDFIVYKEISETLKIDAFVINPCSEAFVFHRDFFDLMGDLPESSFSTDGAYTSSELKELKDSIDNSELEEFVENPKNIGKYEELFEMMSKSTMLTLMLSDQDLSARAKNGVINTLDDGPVGFLHTEELGGNYATMYTSESKIADVHTSFNKYSQIVNPSLMTNFILSDDMDGIIINPNSDNVLLTREVLIEFSDLLSKTCNDPKLNSAIFHMFVIEEA